VLEVDHYGLGADLPYVLRVVGITNKSDGLVATLRQDLGQASSDLAVTSCYGYSHGFKPKPLRDAAAPRVGRPPAEKFHVSTQV